MVVAQSKEIMFVFAQKLTIPRVARYTLHRMNLFAQLDAAATAAQAVFLIGPAGWGKTTALARWAELRAEIAPVAWYSLDQYDHDPVVFLRYLIATLRPHCPALATLADYLDTSLDKVAQQELFERIVAMLAELPQMVHLILDDVHTLIEASGERSRPIFELLDRLLHYAPRLHLILASRTTIPTTVRHQLQGDAIMLTENLLAFTTAEVQALALTRYELTITADEAALLVKWARGWPVAVVLALEDRHQHSDVAAWAQRLVPALVPQMLATFLAEQVLAPLPPPVQRFLLDTSLLDYLTPQRCDALREATDSALLLAEVQRRGLFVLTQGEWVSYHDLFRSFLHQQLWRDPDRARQLTQRAALLHTTWGEAQAAFDLWLSLDNMAAAADLVIHTGPKLQWRGEHATVLGWLELLRNRMELPPNLLLLQAHIAIDLADWNAVYSAIQLAYASGEAEAMLRARLLEIHVACMRQQAEQAQALLATINLESLPPHLRSEGFEQAGRVALLHGQSQQAVDLLRQSLIAYETHPPPVHAASRLAHLHDTLSMALILNGNHTEAAYHLRCADSARQALGEHRRRVITLNNLGVLATYEGNVEAARHFLLDGLLLAERYDHRRGEVILRSSLADVDLIEGHLDAALASYSAAAERAEQLELTADLAYARAGALRAAVLTRNAALRQHWLQIVMQMPLPTDPTYAGVLALARALASDNVDIAESFLIQAAAAPALAPHDRLQVQLLHAQLAFQRGGWNSAAPHWQSLEQAVTHTYFDTLLRLQLSTTEELLSIAATESLLARRLRGVTHPAITSLPIGWSFTALGNFAVARDGQPCTAAVRPLDQLVLIRLLEAQPAGVPVLRLWEDVWGDRPYSSDALRQALSRIRRSTGVPIQLHLGHCQLLIDAAQYDVASFDMPLEHPHDWETLRQRLHIYKGPLLHHLSHKSPWLEARRAALHRRYLSFCETLAALCEEANEPDEALSLYAIVLNEDGCREAAAAGVMRCAIRRGDRALAITTYQRLCRQLFDTLGVDPSPALTQLYQQVA